MRLPSLITIFFAGVMLVHPADAAFARSAKDRNAGHNKTTLPLPGAGLRDNGAARLSADSAAREIQQRHGGRVLAVQPDGAGYRVKLLNEGEVRIYQVGP
jgi:hypothetical protein